jgi:hypothetical protein
LQIFSDSESNSSNDQDVLKAVALKTDKIIKHLHSLAGGEKLTEAIIASNVSNEAMQHWLCRVAIAEGLI